MITGAGHDDSKRDTWFSFLRGCYESNRRAMESTISIPRICTICLVSSGSLVLSISLLLSPQFTTPSFIFHTRRSSILLFCCIQISILRLTDLRLHRLAGSATGGVILKSSFSLVRGFPALPVTTLSHHSSATPAFP